MTRTGLAFGAAITLALLGGCAPYGAYDNGYQGGAGYYAPDYYSGGYGYGQPYGGYGGGGYGGGYGGGAHRDRDHNRDGDHRGPDRNRGQDQTRNQDRGDHQSYNRGGETRGADQRPANPGNTLPNGDRITRGNFWQQNHPEMNAAPAQQPSAGQNSGQGRGNRGRDSGNRD